MIYANASREELRQVWLSAWRKSQDGRVLEPMEAILVDVLSEHPEYHPMLSDDPDSLQRDWTVEGGQSNPFLHMGLHVAVREAVTTDRPAGVAQEFRRMAAQLQDSHAAEHELIEVLAELLWEAQRAGLPPDASLLLERLRRRGRR